MIPTMSCMVSYRLYHQVLTLSHFTGKTMNNCKKRFIFADEK